MLGEMVKLIGNSPKGDEIKDICSIVVALNERMFNNAPQSLPPA